MKVAVVCTVLNEIATIGDLAASLRSQTRPPDEIVFADAGSHDGTKAALAEWAEHDRRVVVVDQPGDRSTGRNAAIEATDAEVIACIDAGCVAEPEWLERLVAPCAHGAQWVAGFYRPDGPGTIATSIGLAMVYVREEVRPDEFLPSARSMAFTRAAWEAAGGFPEGIDFAEDTLFDERLIRAGYAFEFAPEAIVRWRPPQTFRELALTSYRWGHGDGLAGLRRYYPKRRLAMYWGTALALTATLTRRPGLALAVAAPLAATVARQTRFKYRYAPGRAAYAAIPAAHLLSGFAGLVGYTVGLGEARRGATVPRLDPAPRDPR